MAGNGRIYPKMTHSQASNKNINTYKIETHHSRVQNIWLESVRLLQWQAWQLGKEGTCWVQDQDTVFLPRNWNSKCQVLERNPMQGLKGPSHTET